MTDIKDVNIEELVDAVLADGRLTREEHDMIRKVIMADGVIDEKEYEQLERLMDLVDKGTIEVVDTRVDKGD